MNLFEATLFQAAKGIKPKRLGFPVADSQPQNLPIALFVQARDKQRSSKKITGGSVTVPDMEGILPASLGEDFFDTLRHHSDIFAFKRGMDKKHEACVI